MLPFQRQPSSPQTAKPPPKNLGSERFSPNPASCAVACFLFHLFSRKGSDSVEMSQPTKKDPDYFFARKSTGHLSKSLLLLSKECHIGMTPINHPTGGFIYSGLPGFIPFLLPCLSQRSQGIFRAPQKVPWTTRFFNN